MAEQGQNPSFPTNPAYNQFSYGTGLNTGNQSIDQVLSILVGLMGGNNYIAPRGKPGTSIYEQHQNRERWMDMRRVMMTAANQQNYVQALGGLNMNSVWGQTAATLMGNPDNPLTKIMMPFTGGNPMAAQLGLYANLNGTSVANLGRVNQNITAAETAELGKVLNRTFYREREVNRDDVQAVQDLSANNANRIIRDNSELRKTLKAEGFLTSDNKLDINQDVVRLREQTRSENAPRIQELERQIRALDPNSTEARELNTRANELRSGPENITGADVTNRRYVEAIRRNVSTINDEIAQGEEEIGRTRLQELQKQKQQLEKAATELTEAFNPVASAQKLMLERVTRPGEIDYRLTRGFKIEDFTNAFSSANQLGFIGGRDAQGRRASGANINLTGTFENYMRTTGGAFDAARSLFGTSTGQDTMAAINKFVGRGNVDLGNTAQIGEANYDTSVTRLEETQRRVKAAARSANISIDAILGIIEEGRNLAASHPALQYMSGLDVADISLRVLNTATAQASVMGSEGTRLRGGLPQMVREGVENEMRARTEPVATRTAAMMSFLDEQEKAAAASMDPARQTQIGLARTRLVNAIRAGETADASGLNRVTDEVGNISGIGGIRLMRASNMQQYAQQGMRQHGDLAAEASNQSYINAMNTDLDISGQEMFGAGYKQGDMLRRIVAIRRAQPELTFTQALEQAGVVNEHLSQVVLPYAGNALDLHTLKMARPELAAITTRSTEIQALNTKADTKFAREYAHLNAPVIESFAQSLISGRLTSDTINEAARILSGNRVEDGAVFNKNVANLSAIRYMAQDQTPESVATAYAAIRGKEDPLANASTISNLTNVLSQIGVTEVMRLGDMSEADFAADPRGIRAIEALGGHANTPRDITRIHTSIRQAQSAAVSANFTTPENLKAFGDSPMNKKQIMNRYTAGTLREARNTGRAQTLLEDSALATAQLNKTYDTLQKDLAEGRTDVPMLDDNGVARRDDKGDVMMQRVNIDDATRGRMEEYRQTLDKYSVWKDGKRTGALYTDKMMEAVNAGYESPAAAEMIRSKSESLFKHGAAYDQATGKWEEALSKQADQSKLTDTISDLTGKLSTLPNILNAISGINEALKTLTQNS